MVIFLDIDGVMVPAKGWKSPEMLSDGFPAFSNKAVQALNQLLTENGDKIIITSSHKSSYTIEQWKDIFSKRGIAVPSLSALPANANNFTRKDELLNWFQNNEISEDFLIVDDDKSLNDLPAKLKKNLILTKSLIGLTMQDLYPVFNGKFQPK